MSDTPKKIAPKERRNVSGEVLRDISFGHLGLANGEVFTLTGRFAGGDFNKPLQNAMRKLNPDDEEDYAPRPGFRTPKRRRKNRQQEEQEDLDRNLKVVCELFPKYVITGWNEIYEDHSSVPYTPAACQAELEKLEIYDLIAILEFFGNPEHFRVLTKDMGQATGNESGGT